MALEAWYIQQYVTEVQTRIAYEKNRNNRLGMIYGWRCRPHISVWVALPGEAPPTQWLRKPAMAVLNKQAREAWERCDKAKAQELYAMWHHSCQDPYYCPMHGIGSD
jgi:hypothetical protein